MFSKALIHGQSRDSFSIWIVIVVYIVVVVYTIVLVIVYKIVVNVFKGIDTRSESRQFQYPSIPSQTDSRGSCKDESKNQVKKTQS
jgi:flagellar basal body-associated protein FliL